LAFSIFLFVKGLSKLKRKEQNKAVEPETPALSMEEQLLGEIRELLKRQQGLQ
jgi:large conductance mechanosensitive channel